MRVTHSQNIVLPYVKKSDLYTLWQKLDAAGLAPANLDLISDIIACPGLDYCSLANARSIPVAQKISQRFADPERQRDLGELKDRKSVVSGKSVSVRVAHGGRRIINKKKTIKNISI